MHIALMASSGGSGKDTVADMLINLGAVDAKISLGQGIHHICDTLAREPYGRHELQAVGEHMRNVFGEMTWMDYTDGIIKDKYADKSVVIPDVRKLLEFAHYCVEHDYKPLYIKANTNVAKQRLNQRDGGYKQTDLDNSIEHQLDFLEKLPSERVFKNSKLRKIVGSGVFDNVYIVDNNGTLDDLKAQIESWYKLHHDK